MTVKGHVQSKLGKLKYGESKLTAEEYLKELPADPKDLPEALRLTRLPLVVPKLPLEDVLNMARGVPISNKLVKGKGKRQLPQEPWMDPIWPRLFMMPTNARLDAGRPAISAAGVFATFGSGAKYAEGWASSFARSCSVYW